MDQKRLRIELTCAEIAAHANYMCMGQPQESREWRMYDARRLHAADARIRLRRAALRKRLSREVGIFPTHDHDQPCT